MWKCFLIRPKSEHYVDYYFVYNDTIFVIKDKKYMYLSKKLVVHTTTTISSRVYAQKGVERP